MREFASLKLCIIVYGVLIVTVSLGLLFSLSASDAGDVVVVEGRTSNPHLTLVPSEEKITNETASEYQSQASDYLSQKSEGEYHAQISDTSRQDETKESQSAPVVVPSIWEKPSTDKQWPPGICRDFLGDTYNRKANVCPRIVCRGSSYSKSTGTCTVTGVAVRPLQLYNALKRINIKKMKSSHDIIMGSKSAWLVKDEGYQSCSAPSFKDADEFIEQLDYVRPFIRMASLSTQPQTLQCNRWVTGTTYFYIGMENHIYFKFLGWYNLHRSLIANNEITNYSIVRLPEGNNSFLFPDFEKALFPKTVRLQDYQEDVVCFEDLFLVPWAYGAPAFRCRIEKQTLKRKCLQCNGNGIESDYKSFRRRVLAACGLVENHSPFNKYKNILVIERKQYKRRLEDKAKSFTRIWENSHDLINALKTSFPDYNVTGIYAEQLTICQQIQYAFNSTVFIGMHGAGMVHLWWTQENAKVIELIPKSQRGNVAFKTLANFLGRKYQDFTKVTETKENIVNVNVKEVIRTVRSMI